jgi:hypothetical protein
MGSLMAFDLESYVTVQERIKEFNKIFPMAHCNLSSKASWMGRR